MMAFPLKGVNNLTGIYQCGKDSRSALDIPENTRTEKYYSTGISEGKPASFVAEYLTQNVILNPPN
jgi:hypothetical protein